jgi:hypothetical protein
MSNFEERFWSKVEPTGFCWEWTRGTTTDGYGRAWDPRIGKAVYAHRAAYEMLVGPIPEGMHLDHLCRNRRCVNPDHLEVVSPSENSRRARRRPSTRPRATRCKWGHPYDEKNTYVSPTGRRNCRACNLRLTRARTRARM